MWWIGFVRYLNQKKDSGSSSSRASKSLDISVDELAHAELRLLQYNQLRHLPLLVGLCHAVSR